MTVEEILDTPHELQNEQQTETQNPLQEEPQVGLIDASEHELEGQAEATETRQDEREEAQHEENKPQAIIDERPEPEILVEATHDAPITSATRLYTDSEIGSPSTTHATPDVPVRHGSFSYASLPPRDILASTRQQSLGLDSDATEEEPVYVRAPELVAHEERMRAYEEPTPQPTPQPKNNPAEAAHPHLIETSAASGPSGRKTRSMTQREAEEQRRAEEKDQATIDEQQTTLSHPDNEQTSNASTEKQSVEPAIEEESNQTPTTEATVQEEQASRIEQGIEEPAQEQATEISTVRENGTERSTRLRAPRNLGPPVRRTNTTAATQQIRIRSLAQSRPVNPAPVAPHNETRRVRSTKPPTQFVNIPPRPQTQPPKSFAAAQRKKGQDEAAAARDAAIKAQQLKRRDDKIEEIRTKKREENDALDREARRKSDENARKHIRDLDEIPGKRARAELRQEREEAAAAEQKRINRENIINRQNALQGRLYGSSIRPLTMMELNPARPASRLDMHDREANANEASPRAQDRESTQRTTRAGPASRPNQRQSQQENTLPPYPNSISRAPIRGSNFQRVPIFNSNVSQAGPASLNNFPAPPARAPDMRQYATQRPPMANELPSAPATQAPSRAQPQSSAPATTTRLPMQNPNTMRLVQAIRESSPIASNISLPEIHTDSSEDSDRASLPSWVSPGHIFDTLVEQQTFDTDRIFGPIKRVAIDDVFGTMPPEKRQRLNMRTSSANWVRTGDALTQVEVIEDRAGREAIKNAGGWVYGIGDCHNHETHGYKRHMN